MNSILFPFQQKITTVTNSNRANLPQNGLQKYTIPTENNDSNKKKVFLIKSLTKKKEPNS